MIELDYAPDKPERTADNACPECPTGVVIQIGPMEWQTGHTPYGCTDCRWTS